MTEEEFRNGKKGGKRIADKYAVLPASHMQTSEASETLRDKFAMAVLTGMFAHDCYDGGQATAAQRAKLAYIEADAMLAARKIKKTS